MSFTTTVVGVKRVAVGWLVTAINSFKASFSFQLGTVFAPGLPKGLYDVETDFRESRKFRPTLSQLKHLRICRTTFTN